MRALHLGVGDQRANQLDSCAGVLQVGNHRVELARGRRPVPELGEGNGEDSLRGRGMQLQAQRACLNQAITSGHGRLAGFRRIGWLS